MQIPCHGFKQQAHDLLTDPRWLDADFLFQNDDPLADPPEEWTKVGDVNTGLAHRKTHELLIKPAPYTALAEKSSL